jgi:hypothetical protein
MNASMQIGLRRRTVEIEVFDDIVLVVAMKTQAEIRKTHSARAVVSAVAKVCQLIEEKYFVRAIVRNQ